MGTLEKADEGHRKFPTSIIGHDYLRQAGALFASEQFRASSLSHQGNALEKFSLTLARFHGRYPLTVCSV
jgi:hypothetical protein